MSGNPAEIRSIRFNVEARLGRDAASAATEWYSSGDEAFKAGFWAGQPGSRQISYEIDEICFVVEGEIRLTDSSGNVETYTAGDTFLIPAGFKGVWETVLPVRKFYAIYSRPSQ